MLLAASVAEDLFRAVLQGTPPGTVYALVALGFILTYKTSGVFNLAFGAQAYVSAAMFLPASQSLTVIPFAAARSSASSCRSMGSRNVTVNAVAPGFIETDMSEAVRAKAGDFIQKKLVPLRRLGKPEDIAGVVAFLAGPGSSAVTGAIVPVDGGLGL